MAFLVGVLLAFAVGVFAAWCLAYDVTAAAYLAWLIKTGRAPAST